MSRYKQIITEHRDEILEMRAKGWTLKQIAEYFNCPTIASRGLGGIPRPPRGLTRMGVIAKTVEEQKKVSTLHYILGGQEHFDPALKELVKSTRKQLPPPLTLEGDWIITSDWHIPFINLEVYDLVMEYGEKIPNLLVAGDLFNFANLKKELIIYVTSATVNDEIKICKKLSEELSQRFKQIVVLVGNHDLWLIRKLEGEIAYPDFLKTLDSNLITTPYAYCLINTSEGVWRISHPFQYRKNPFSFHNDLKKKVNKEHIVIAHYHRFAFGLSPDGETWYVELPACSDVSMLDYANLLVTSYPRQVQGFMLLIDGKPSFELIDAGGKRWSFFMTKKET